MNCLEQAGKSQQPALSKHPNYQKNLLRTYLSCFLILMAPKVLKMYLSTLSRKLMKLWNFIETDWNRISDKSIILVLCLSVWNLLIYTTPLINVQHAAISTYTQNKKYAKGQWIWSEQMEIMNFFRIITLKKWSLSESWDSPTWLSRYSIILNNKL